MISYAQNFEDVVLWRAFQPNKTGTYVDVGASDPITHSVTKHFYDLGWRGINIEPDPDTFLKLKQTRPQDININTGCGREKSIMTYTRIVNAQGLSTFHTDLANHYKNLGMTTETLNIEVKPLNEIFEENKIDHIDFLKVDSECFELQVFQGIDLKKYRPRVIVAEMNEYELWEPILLNADYHFCLWDGINRFYVRAEEKDTLGPLISRPATIALDHCGPWHYISRLQEADQIIHQLENENAQLIALIRGNSKIMRAYYVFCQEMKKLISLYKKMGIKKIS